MSDEQEKQGASKVIDMAEARRRQQTLQKKKKKDAAGEFKIAGYSLWNWAQFSFFMLLIVYATKQCGR
jgi:hypothetical protein